MHADPDAELVRALSAPDEERRREALAELYDRHHRRVFNVALRVTLDWYRAQDVLQEVFLNLERSVRSFRGDASFTSWMYRITVNRAIDARRKEARRPASRLGEAAGDLEEAGLPGSDPVTPEGAVWADERTRDIHAAFAELSPKLRTVAVLRYVEGLSYLELSEALNCSLGTVKSRLNRAHAALTAALEKHRPPDAIGPAEMES